MYHAFVQRRVRNAFNDLSNGNYRTVLEISDPNVHHAFAGIHPLGGERHRREAVKRWFERLFRLFPQLRFEVHDILVKGWPWNTKVAVAWIAQVTPLTGEPYENEGVHLIQFRWGRLVHFHAYEDSQKVADACRRMAAEGIEEAAAAPITE